ncbi:unnamed protein product [Mytilus coruscus]|uniref:Peptidase A2 domain-containing protein n=1 Tax=Mytilus coruscus TaxID=42192 RepID=A0A6J8DKQ4_MYTCO|nr:unnamed protein product [Mytilus coruscus]
MDDSGEVIIAINHSFQEENDGEITIPLDEQKVDSVDSTRQIISHDKEQYLFVNEFKNFKSLFHDQLGEITNDFSDCQKEVICAEKQIRQDFEDEMSSIKGSIMKLEDDEHENKITITNLYKMMKQNKDLVNHNDHMSDIVNTENISKVISGVGQTVPIANNQTNQNTEKQQQNTDNIYLFNKDKMCDINQNYAVMDRPQVPRLAPHTHSPKSGADLRLRLRESNPKSIHEAETLAVRHELSEFKKELVSLAKDIKGMSQNQNNRNRQGGDNNQRNQNGQRGHFNNQNKIFGQGNRNFNQRNNNFGQKRQNQPIFYQQGNQLRSDSRVGARLNQNGPNRKRSMNLWQIMREGLFEKAKINDKYLAFLVDTGANTTILMARSIVNPEMYHIPIRIINVNNEPCTLYKGTIIATCNKFKEEDIQTSEFVNNVFAGQATVNKGRQLPDYLLEIYESSQVNLDKDQSEKFKDLLIEYNNIFSKSSEDIGLTDLVEHTINTGNHPPIRQRPRRIPLARIKDAEAEIQKMV